MKDNKFGEYLVMNNIITIKDLTTALKTQVDLMNNLGIEKKLGEILVDEMNKFNYEKLDELLEEYINQ